MNDNISRQAAIDAIIAKPAWHNKQGSWYHGSDIRNALEHLPSIDQWIPFSERKPAEREWIGTKTFGTTISDEILITFDVNGKRFVRPMNLQNGELSGTDKSSMDAFFKGWKMIAWMPLPEPHKGDE